MTNVLSKARTLFTLFQLLCIFMCIHCNIGLSKLKKELACKGECYIFKKTDLLQCSVLFH